MELDLHKKREKQRENNLHLRNHTFVGSIQAWVHGFRRLGSWVHRLSSWVLGFVAWVRCLGLLVRGFAVGFMGSLLGSSTGFVVSVFSVLISCFHCFTDWVCCFFGCRWFFFFSKEEEEEEETEVSWVSFVEVEFHVNFNRNRVCDTWFATVMLSPLDLRC